MCRFVVCIYFKLTLFSISGLAGFWSNVTKIQTLKFSLFLKHPRVATCMKPIHIYKIFTLPNTRFRETQPLILKKFRFHLIYQVPGFSGLWFLVSGLPGVCSVVEKSNSFKFLKNWQNQEKLLGWNLHTSIK